jgi:hypothetical protein
VDAAGEAPWWLSIGLVLAALVALLRSDRRPLVLTAWLGIVLGLGTTAALASAVVTVPGSDSQAFAWLGFPVVVAQASAILAVGLAADGVTRHVRSATFGWRQPVAAATALLAVAGPLAGLVWWAGAAPRGELTRGPAVPLPAYMVDAMENTAEPRVLTVSATRADDGTYSDTYTISTGDGIRLGDDSVLPDPTNEVADLVADVVSDARPDDVARLADLGIAYVVMPAPYDTDQVAQLDGLAGLDRASTTIRRLAGWQLAAGTGLVRLIHGGHPDARNVVLPSNAGRVDQAVPSGQDRVVVVATNAGDGFSAELDGARLSPKDVGSAIGFTVGDEAGRLTVGPGGHRVLWLLAQGVAVLVTLVLALPTARRTPLGGEQAP